ncbi:pyridoxal phosphate-dependent aminotransferase [Hornefia butyriciproducens]|uniref:Aminotransferase n=1 Tax=Hornefia butyriciproducens TaxID=2652293 RepID=A0A6L5Y896_9FIRM|nr:pyridoxal phosphate-dependent aminotransferase [Hornefia butyriciproducens]MCI7413608.1 pyridoxal phosphate-dependent aminotransferase [Clostridiales bacterium]MDD6299937.1 pyridoxal phosphate-dependent aminotransferase [Hornefia butyriciproducens]MDY5424503.1 pyridoxal phosphate-dependent aminotransferase [Hornefia butyriciproducens]MDY5463383.1 pyridoxal phosphate-dependent aminotransferase [Hornefia butyriciproducens]MST52117.1 pyridoxal phosphate-dependent aminotransferase [Hornefia but
MNISKRVNAMQFSPIRKFNPMAIEAEKNGKKIYHLNIGQPDVETPECFMEAIRNFDEKVIAYAESGGRPELISAVIDYYKKYDIELEPSNMIVTNGGSEALSMAFLSLLNDGDEVLIPEPYYTNYSTFALMAGGIVKPIPADASKGYAYADRENIEACITPKTRVICCLEPGNPTGNVLTLEEMKVICEIAEKHDLAIIADEVYREFVYDGRTPVSFGQLSEYADRVIIVDSVSKRFSACGARIGLLISKNKEFMSGCMKIAQGRLCVSTVDQIGSAALFRLPDSYYEEAKAIYCGRRDAVVEELRKIPGMNVVVPAGAFYLTCALPVEDIEDFLTFLLTEFEDNGESVMFAPAAGFYATPGKGKNEIRIAYVLKEEDMRRGVELIRLGLEAYNKKLGK